MEVLINCEDHNNFLYLTGKLYLDCRTVHFNMKVYVDQLTAVSLKLAFTGAAISALALFVNHEADAFLCKTLNQI